MNKEEFISKISELKISLSDNQLNQLDDYYKLILEASKTQNLTTILEKKDVYLKHFYDSLTITKCVDLNEIKTLCDVGTGAGFPGIVLNICFPNLEVTLIDSTLKKVVFLNNVIKELKLKNISAICERAEKHTKKYDIVTSRAVARLTILLEICLPITKTNGFFIAMKANAKEEIKQSESALNTLNGKIIDIKEFSLINSENQRTLIKIQKTGEINKKYPRNFEQIIKKPL